MSESSDDRPLMGSYQGTYRGKRVAIRDVNEWARRHIRRGSIKKIAAKWIAFFPDENKKAPKTFKRCKDAVAWLGGNSAFRF